MSPSRTRPATQARTGARPRRGVALGALVLLIAVINVGAAATMSAGPDEVWIGAMRVESLRALYAAESGAMVAVRTLEAGLPAPAQGSTIELSGASVRYEVVDTPPSGTQRIEVLGTAGEAMRRVGILFDVQ